MEGMEEFLAGLVARKNYAAAVAMDGKRATEDAKILQR
jgi:hypothetical protein